VNDARLKISLQKYNTAQSDLPLSKIKGIDAGIPCQDVLMQEFKWGNYVAYLWKLAHLRDPLANM